jgi:hypothetical protein
VGVHTVRCHGVCGFCAVVGTVLLPVVPFCTCALILSPSESMKNNGMDRTCSAYGGEETCIKGLDGVL